MEQKLSAGLVLSRLAILKKNEEEDCEKLLSVLFFMFSWAKKNLFLNYGIVRSKKLHKMNVEKQKTNLRKLIMNLE